MPNYTQTPRSAYASLSACLTLLLMAGCQPLPLAAPVNEGPVPAPRPAPPSRIAPLASVKPARRELAALNSRIESDGLNDKLVMSLDAKLLQAVRAKGFQTQASNLSQVAFVSVTVTCPESGEVFHNTGGLIPVDHVAAKVTIPDIPRGKNRVITAQFYDAGQNPIALAVAMGIYSSRSGGGRVDALVNRRSLVLGRVILALMDDHAQLASDLNVAELQALLDTTLYGGGVPSDTFTIDPSLINIEQIVAELIAATGQVSGVGPLSYFTSDLTVPVSGLLGSDTVTVRVDDPTSYAATQGNGYVTVTGIAPGNWKVYITLNSASNFSYSGTLGGSPFPPSGQEQLLLSEFVSDTPSETGGGGLIPIGGATPTPLPTGVQSAFALLPEPPVNPVPLSKWTRTGKILRIKGRGFYPDPASNQVRFVRDGQSFDASVHAATSTELAVSVPYVDQGGAYTVQTATGCNGTPPPPPSPGGGGGGIIQSSLPLDSGRDFDDVYEAELAPGGTTPSVGCQTSSTISAFTGNQQVLVNVLAVKPGGPAFDAASSNGLGWDKAINLESALLQARRGNAIWLMKGSYKPSGATPDSRFNLTRSLSLYGGFEGDETRLEERGRGVSSLDGDHLGNDSSLDPNHASRSDNSQVVLNSTAPFSASNPSFLSLDRLTIRGGNALSDEGAGLRVTSGNLRLNKVIFTNNSAFRAGALAAYALNQVSLSEVVFRQNRALQEGGGMLLGNAEQLAMQQVDFEDNSANLGGGLFLSSSRTLPYRMNAVNFRNNAALTSGGGLYSQAVSAELTNATFSGNQAQVTGGAVFSEASQLTLTNASFANNAAPVGGGMLNFGGIIDGINWGSNTPLLTNVLFFNSPYVRAANDPDTGYVPDTPDPGQGNLSVMVDPFENSAAHNLRIKASATQVINQGVASRLNGDNQELVPALDASGQARSGKPEPGAYEYSP